MLSILKEADLDAKNGNVKISLLIKDKKINITRLELFLISNVTNNEGSFIRIEPMSWNGTFYVDQSDADEIYKDISKSSFKDEAKLLIEQLNGEGSDVLDGVHMAQSSNQTFAFEAKRRINR